LVGICSKNSLICSPRSSEVVPLKKPPPTLSFGGQVSQSSQARLSNFEKPRGAVAGTGFAFICSEHSEELRQNGNAKREEKSSPEIFVWFSKLAKPSV